MQHWLNSVYSYLHSSCMPGHSHSLQSQHSWVTSRRVGSNPLMGTAIIFFPVDMLSTFYLFIGCLLAPRMHKHMHRHTIHDTNTKSTLHTQPPTNTHTGLVPLDLQLVLVAFFSYQLTQKHIHDTWHKHQKHTAHSATHPHPQRSSPSWSVTCAGGVFLIN